MLPKPNTTYGRLWRHMEWLIESGYRYHPEDDPLQITWSRIPSDRDMERILGKHHLMEHAWDMFDFYPQCKVLYTGQSIQ